MSYLEEVALFMLADENLQTDFGAFVQILIILILVGIIKRPLESESRNSTRAVIVAFFTFTSVTGALIWLIYAITVNIQVFFSTEIALAVGGVIALIFGPLLLFILYNVLRFREDPGIIEALHDIGLHPQVFVDLPRSHTRQIIKVGVPVFVITIPLILWYASQREKTFTVFIDMHPLYAESGKVCNLEPFRNEVEGLLDKDDLGIIFTTDPEDRVSADLKLEINFKDSETCVLEEGHEVQWSWEANSSKEFQQGLDSFLLGNTSWRPSPIPKPYRKLAKYELAAFVTFSDGLSHYLEQDLREATRSFRKTNYYLGKINPRIYEDEEEWIQLPASIASCVRVLDYLSNQASLSDRDVENLQEALDPLGQGESSANFCIALSHYLLGKHKFALHEKEGNPNKRSDLLTEALEEFSKAIEIVDDLGQEHLSDHLYYRGLSSYRSGNFKQAYADFSRASEQFSDSIFNETPLEQIEYLLVRIVAENYIYGDALEADCPNTAIPFDVSPSEIVAQFGTLEAIGANGLAPTKQNPRGLYQASRFQAARGHILDIEGSMGLAEERGAIPLAAKAEQIADNNGDESINSLVMDTYLASLYKASGDEEKSNWYSIDEAALLESISPPAYVLPLSPRLDPRPDECSSIERLNISHHPIVFQWVIRDHFDEPVFADNLTKYEVLLGDAGSDPDLHKEWQIEEDGFNYGLFESDPINFIAGAFTASSNNEAEGGIRLSSVQLVSLLRKTELGDDVIPVGTLPVTADGRLNIDPENDLNYVRPTGTEPAKAEVSARIMSDNITISELTINDLEFRATMLKKKLCKNDEETCVETVHLEEAGKYPFRILDIRLKQVGKTVNFIGQFDSLPEDFRGIEYGVKFYVLDRDGREIYETFLEWPEIPG